MYSCKLSVHDIVAGWDTILCWGIQGMPASAAENNQEAVNKSPFSVSLEGIKQTRMDLAAVPWPASGTHSHSNLGLAPGRLPPLSKSILNIMIETEVTHP